MPRPSKLSESEITQALEGLPGWTRDGDAIVRKLHFRDFIEAFGFLSQLAILQEQLDHHATITNTYADVELRLSTHDADGITSLDFELAKRAEERASNLSAK